MSIGGQRLSWAELPKYVRLAVEEYLGSTVQNAASQSGGFSPGVASRLQLANGRRAFIKAVNADRNPDSPDIHRKELRIAKALPAGAPVPQLIWSYDDGNWVVLLYEDIDGHQPITPWEQNEVTRVLDALTILAQQMTPSPISAPQIAEALAEEFSGWRDLQANRVPELSERYPWAAEHLEQLAQIEATWDQAAHGETLLHCDLRADNILLTDHQVFFVDWPHACIGAGWLDLVLMLPSMAMHGIDPEAVLTSYLPARNVNAKDIDVVLVALAGYFVSRSLKPAPPGLPTIRGFQAAQGVAALDWLERRLMF